MEVSKTVVRARSIGLRQHKIASHRVFENWNARILGSEPAASNPGSKPDEESHANGAGRSTCRIG